MRYDAVLAETVGIQGAGNDEIEAYTARPMDGASPRRRGGDPPHARLRPRDQGDRAAVRRHGLQRHLPEPLQRARPPARTRTTPPPPRAPTAACPTTGSSATPPVRCAGCARCRTSNGRVGDDRLLLRRAPGVPHRPRAGHPGRRRLLRRVRRRRRRPRGSRCRCARSAHRVGRACAPRCSGCSATRTRTRRPPRSTSWRSCCSETARPTSSTATTTPGTRSSPSTGPAYRVAAARRRLAADPRLLRDAPVGRAESACAPTAPRRSTSRPAAGRGRDGWFPLRTATVYYDHPVHAPRRPHREHRLPQPGARPGGPGGGRAGPATRPARCSPRCRSRWSAPSTTDRCPSRSVRSSQSPWDLRGPHAARPRLPISPAAVRGAAWVLRGASPLPPRRRAPPSPRPLHRARPPRSPPRSRPDR